MEVGETRQVTRTETFLKANFPDFTGKRTYLPRDSLCSRVREAGSKRAMGGRAMPCLKTGRYVGVRYLQAQRLPSSCPSRRCVLGSPKHILSPYTRARTHTHISTHTRSCGSGVPDGTTQSTRSTRAPHLEVSQVERTGMPLWNCEGRNPALGGGRPGALPAGGGASGPRKRTLRANTHRPYVG